MSGGGLPAAGGGGGRVARALRLLFLLVLALAFVEYMSGSILDSTAIRTYLSMPSHNVTRPLPTPRSWEKLASLWPKRTQHRPTGSPEPNTDQIVALNATNLHNDNSAKATVVVNKTSSANASASDIQSVFSPFVTTDTDIYLNTSKEEPLEDKLPQCPAKISDLGPVPFNKTTILNLEAVDRKYPDVQEGGRYAPPHCRAKDKVAIVVPFRDRDEHLALFLDHLHPFLMKQQIDYGIFIVEQNGKKPFNRAKLMNVGFFEAQNSREGGYDCYIFHDIDLLPLDTRNLYTCPKQPRHMSVAIDKHNFKLPYADIFGGVSALTVAQFVAVNGFSNKYWGWGGEDDDMAYRIKKKRFHIARYPMSIARYVMLDHKPQSANPKRYQLLAQTNKVFSTDGLTSLEYEITKTTKHHLYTNILANIDEKS